MTESGSDVQSRVVTMNQSLSGQESNLPQIRSYEFMRCEFEHWEDFHASLSHIAINQGC